MPLQDRQDQDVSAARAPIAGVRIGKYQLIRRLAIGGMAELFLARATGIEGFEKVVVLKRILPQYSEDARFIQMFLREARLAATLQHSNIAQVYDIGRSDGTYFFAMEYVHGMDVRHIQARAKAVGGAIPLEHAIAIIVNTAAGLHHAHEKADLEGRPLRLVHRDVSPSNVLVGFDGGVKLVDFGIAKATDQRNETRPGTLKGKVCYMSPEQCRAEPLDRRSDIFSLGVLLYELATGRHLFDGESELATLKQITEQDVVHPASVCPGFPPELARIVLKALRRNAAERYATAQELQLDLEGFARAQKWLLSASSLASFLEELFGREVDTWRQAEQAGMSLADYVTSSMGSGTAETEVSEDAQPDTDVVAEANVGPADRPVAAESATEEASSPHGARGTAGRSRLYVVLGGALAVALGVALLRNTQSAPVPVTPKGSRPSPEPPRAAAIAEVPAPSPPSPSVVQIHLRGVPERARILLDDRRVPDNPFMVERGSKLRHIVVTAKGYQSREIDVVPSQNLDLPISLGLPASRRAKPSSRPKKVEPPDPEFIKKL